MVKFEIGDIIYTKDIKGNIIYEPKKIIKISIITGGNLKEGLTTEYIAILDDNKEYRLLFENKNYNVYNVYAIKVNEENKTCNDIFINFILKYVIRV
jgi:hypothetical protein